MTRAHLASLLLPAAPLLLVLSACGDGQGGASDSKGDAPAAPLGFELAAAATAGKDAASAFPAPVVEVTPQALWAAIAAGEVRVIDVRTPEETASGVIPQAELIPLDRFDPAKLDLSDGRKVVLYCRSGRRSAVAAERLAAFTGEPAEHLAGGMLAWEAARLPVDRR